MWLGGSAQGAEGALDRDARSGSHIYRHRGRFIYTHIQISYMHLYSFLNQRNYNYVGMTASDA